MAQKLPIDFEAHIESAVTELVPVVFIGDFDDMSLLTQQEEQNHQFGTPGEQWGHGGLMLSTQPIQVMPHGENPMGTNSYIQCHPLLKEPPQIKEKIDLKKRKYRINDVTLKIFIDDYDGIPITDHRIMRYLMNNEVRIWWAYPPFEMNTIEFRDLLQETRLPYSRTSAYFAYRGMVRDVKEDSEMITIIVEDRSQDVLHADVPIARLPSIDGMREDMKRKIIPMHYGFMDKAPHVVYSGGDVEGYYLMPDRSVAGLLPDTETVMLYGENHAHDVFIEQTNAYRKVPQSTMMPVDNMEDIYAGPQYDRYPGHIHIYSLHLPQTINDILFEYRNPPADNILQTYHHYSPTSTRGFSAEDDYGVLVGEKIEEDFYWGMFLHRAYVMVHFVSTMDGEVDGPFPIYWKHDPNSPDEGDTTLHFYHIYVRNVNYNFSDPEDHKAGTSIYERFWMGGYKTLGEPLSEYLPPAPQQWTEMFPESWEQGVNAWPAGQPNAWMQEWAPNIGGVLLQGGGPELQITNTDINNNGNVPFSLLGNWYRHLSDGAVTDTNRSRNLRMACEAIHQWYDEDNQMAESDLEPCYMKMWCAPGGADSGASLETIAYANNLDKMKFYAKSGGRQDPDYVMGGYGGSDGERLSGPTKKETIKDIAITPSRMGRRDNPNKYRNTAIYKGQS